MGHYRLRAQAKADLRRIYRRGLREFGEAQADRYYAALFKGFARIASHPLLYPAVDDVRPGYRRCVCGRESIFYRIIGSDVEIMALVGRQDLDAWLLGTSGPS